MLVDSEHSVRAKDCDLPPVAAAAATATAAQQPPPLGKRCPLTMQRVVFHIGRGYGGA